VRPWRLLVLGGTTEANALVAELVGDAGIEVTTSLAGRTRRPRVPHGQLRVGGFGGVVGLVRHLQEHGTDAVVDALHPFAATMPFHAAAACVETGTPLLRLRRAAWAPGPGDRWDHVADLTAAAGLLRARGARRVLLTTGRQELDPFRPLDAVRFVVRSIEPADLGGFSDAVAVEERPPFTVAGELELMRHHRVDTVVSKNSGGTATAAKLEAARRLGLGVVMVRRPPLPAADSVATVAEAVAWVRATAAALSGTSEG
jgi:precorrin-6A/cobalt-precorrin-6A reductase